MYCQDEGRSVTDYGVPTHYVDFRQAQLERAGLSHRAGNRLPRRRVCAGVGPEQNLACLVDRHRRSATPRCCHAATAPAGTEGLGAQDCAGNRKQAADERQLLDCR